MDRYKKIKVIGKGAFGAAVLVQARSDPKQQFVVKQVGPPHAQPTRHVCSWWSAPPPLKRCPRRLMYRG
jgi:hypothetical protein